MGSSSCFFLCSTSLSFNFSYLTSNYSHSASCRPQKKSSLFMLVEPHGAISQAVCEYPENAKHHRHGRARADSAVGHRNQDDLDLSTQVVDTDAMANAHLSLSLNPGPKDISKGFVFGSDPLTCDVILAKDKTSGISGNHFSINVDWRSGNPLITCLTPGDGTGIQILSASVWKLYLRAESKEIEHNATIIVRVSRRIKLAIHNPSRNRDEFGYNRNLQDYLKRCQDAIPSMSRIRLYDPEQTPLMISRTRGLTGREYETTTSSFVGDEIILCEARGLWARDSKIYIVKRFRNTSYSWKKHAKTKLSMLRGLRQVSDLERMPILNFILTLYRCTSSPLKTSSLMAQSTCRSISLSLKKLLRIDSRAENVVQTASLVWCSPKLSSV